MHIRDQVEKRKSRLNKKGNGSQSSFQSRSHERIVIYSSLELQDLVRNRLLEHLIVRLIFPPKVGRMSTSIDLNLAR